MTNKYYSIEKLWHMIPKGLSSTERQQWLNDLATMTKSTRLKGHYDAETGYGKSGNTCAFRYIHYDILLFTDELHSFVKQRSKELGKKVPVRYFTKNQKEEILP